jgi:hypothetical protein
MVTVVGTVTAVVVTVKDPLVAPAAMVTEAGTVATAVLFDDSVTTAPPLGAALVSNSEPETVPPPSTKVGVRVTVDSPEMPVTVSVAVWVEPWYAADSVTVVVTVFNAVVAVKVALVAPAAPRWL